MRRAVTPQVKLKLKALAREILVLAVTRECLGTTESLLIPEILGKLPGDLSHLDLTE